MQGPKLKVVAECGNCEFLGITTLCKKLNISLELRNGLVQPNENCPFVEENAIRFHSESITQISKIKEIKNKETLKSIFNNDSMFSIKPNEIFVTSESITCSMIDKVKLHFPDYTMEFSVADNYNVCLSLTKKLIKG